MNPAPNGFYATGPPMMNPPPPRLFGSGSYDPSQMPPGNMFHDDMDDHNDGSDAKRRRIARVPIALRDRSGDTGEKTRGKSRTIRHTQDEHR
jgi:hypothetical protein